MTKLKRSMLWAGLVVAAVGSYAGPTLAYGQAKPTIAKVSGSATTLKIRGKWTAITYQLPVRYYLVWHHSGEPDTIIRYSKGLADTIALKRVRGVPDTVSLCTGVWQNELVYGVTCGAPSVYANPLPVPPAPPTTPAPPPVPVPVPPPAPPPAPPPPPPPAPAPVPPPPAAPLKADFSSTCPTLQCTVDASASGPGVVSWTWDWGVAGKAKETRTDATNRNTWPASGSYVVTLVVKNTAGDSAAAAKVITVGTVSPAPPPAPAPAPSPLPPPAPAPAGVLAAADFENGTLGGFVSLGGGTSVVDDPTGQLAGKVLRIDYSGNTSVNRSIEVLKANVTGTLWFTGDLVIPTPAKGAMRKLVYFHINPYAYGNPIPPGVPSIAAGVGLMGSSLYAWGFYNSTTQFNNLGAITFGQKVHLEVEVNLGSLGATDGYVRIYLNGTPLWTSPPLLFRKDPRDGLGYFQIGEQAQSFDGLAVNELRYWDNVTLSTVRLP